MTTSVSWYLILRVPVFVITVEGVDEERVGAESIHLGDRFVTEEANHIFTTLSESFSIFGIWIGGVVGMCFVIFGMATTMYQDFYLWNVGDVVC